MSDKMDKVYDLLEKMYIELQETKQEVKETSKRISNIEKGQLRLETTIENEIRPSIKLLFEGQTRIFEKLEEHDHRFDILEEKLEKHDVEIRVIKNDKKKAKGS